MDCLGFGALDVSDFGALEITSFRRRENKKGELKEDGFFGKFGNLKRFRNVEL